MKKTKMGQELIKGAKEALAHARGKKKLREKIVLKKVIKLDTIEKWYPETVMGHKRDWKKGPCCFSPTPQFTWDKDEQNGFVGGALHELLPYPGQWKKGKRYEVTIREL